MNGRPKERDLITGRWRTIRAPEVSESLIQTTIFDRYRWKGRPDVVGLHVPNGLELNPRAGAALKRMGLYPGTFDTIWHRPYGPCPHCGGHLQNAARVLWIELKRATGLVSAQQFEFERHARRAAAETAIHRDSEEAIDDLRTWGAFS